MSTEPSQSMPRSNKMPSNLTSKVAGLYMLLGGGLNQCGRCGEAQVLSTAERAGISAEGGTFLSLRIRGPNSLTHGTLIEACPSCRPVLNYFGGKGQ